MRRFFFSAAIMAIVAGGPLAAHGGDREIAQQIIENLKVHRDAGTLKDFTLDLKVDSGVVLLRGSVQHADQKANVLAAATGIDGIAKVVDEIEVLQAAKAAGADETTTIVRPPAAVAEVTAAPQQAAQEAPEATDKAATKERFSFKDALAAVGPALQSYHAAAVSPAGNMAADQAASAVQPAAATETQASSDAQITAAVVASLGAAQRQGRLKGFGVDVNTRDGHVRLSGRASSEQQRELINDLVRQTPGVRDVQESIAVIGSKTPRPSAEAELELQPLPEPSGFGPQRTPGTLASTRTAAKVPAQAAPYRMDQGVPMNQAGVAVAAPVVPAPVVAAPVEAPVHGGYAGMPVPMAPYAGVGVGPRLEQPYLPNYAWPGYAAYPNYAAVSYPQQYSPSAFPYIGPFYPYPQVPLGWRKVSLEWDDGWWYLDFTDR